MAPKQKVNVHERGRQLRRYFDKHANLENNPRGFTKYDLDLMEEYCPETGTKEGELPFPLNWEKSSASMAQSRNWWRKQMAALGDDTADHAEPEQESEDEDEPEPGPDLESQKYPRRDKELEPEVELEPEDENTEVNEPTQHSLGNNFFDNAPEGTVLATHGNIPVNHPRRSDRLSTGVSPPDRNVTQASSSPLPGVQDPLFYGGMLNPRGTRIDNVTAITKLYNGIDSAMTMYKSRAAMQTVDTTKDATSSMMADPVPPQTRGILGHVSPKEPTSYAKRLPKAFTRSTETPLIGASSSRLSAGTPSRAHNQFPQDRLHPLPKRPVPSTSAHHARSQPLPDSSLEGRVGSWVESVPGLSQLQEEKVSFLGSRDVEREREMQAIPLLGRASGSQQLEQGRVQESPSSLRPHRYHGSSRIPHRPRKDGNSGPGSLRPRTPSPEPEDVEPVEPRGMLYQFYVHRRRNQGYDGQI